MSSSIVKRANPEASDSIMKRATPKTVFDSSLIFSKIACFLDDHSHQSFMRVSRLFFDRLNNSPLFITLYMRTRSCLPPERLLMCRVIRVSESTSETDRYYGAIFKAIMCEENSRFGSYITMSDRASREKLPIAQRSLIKNLDFSSLQFHPDSEFLLFNKIESNYIQKAISLPALESLNLSGSKLLSRPNPPEGILRNLQDSLKRLILNDNIEMEDQVLIEGCPGLINLEELELSRTFVSGAVLLALPNKSKLRKLHLMRCSRLDGMYLAEVFSAFSSLIEVRLRETRVNAAVLLALPQENDHLRVLDLAKCSGLQRDLLIAILQKFSKLEELYLGEISMTGNELLQFSKESCLRSLSLQGCKRLDENYLAETFRNLTDLEKLELSESVVSGRSILSLNSSLKALDLRGCDYLDWKCLIEILKRFQNLQELTLSYGTATKELLSRSKELLPHCCLRRLYLHGCAVSGENEFTDLSSFLSKLPNLEELNLPGISFEGQKIKNCDRKFPSVKKLSFQRIFPKQREELSLANFLSKFPNVRVLDFSRSVFYPSFLTRLNGLMNFERMSWEEVILIDCKERKRRSDGEFESRKPFLEMELYCPDIYKISVLKRFYWKVYEDLTSQY